MHPVDDLQIDHQLYDGDTCGLYELDFVDHFWLREAQQGLVQDVHHADDLGLRVVLICLVVRLGLKLRNAGHHEVHITRFNGQLGRHGAKDLDSDVATSILVVKSSFDDFLHMADEALSLLVHGRLVVLNLLDFLQNFLLQCLKIEVKPLPIGPLARLAVLLQLGLVLQLLLHLKLMELLLLLDHQVLIERIQDLLHLWILGVLFPESLEVLLVQDAWVQHRRLHGVSLILAFALPLATSVFGVFALFWWHLWTTQKVRKHVWRGCFGYLKSFAVDVQR